jgi:hypothetical protein
VSEYEIDTTMMMMIAARCLVNNCYNNSTNLFSVKFS